jgi:hypothetical protein
MKNQEYLNFYFRNVWAKRDRSLDQYNFTGYSLVEKIRPGERVIDVGCGMNPFKGLIPNLVGVDPAFDQADYKLTLEEYATAHPAQKFNVAFCLGSVNFGTQGEIEHQIDLVTKLLHKRDSRIYWRCNPGSADHGNQECNQIDFFPWSCDELIRLAEKFGFRVVDMDWDSNNRIYAEWWSTNTNPSNIA